MASIDNDAETLLGQFQQSADRDITQSSHSFIVCNKQQVISWSDNHFVPALASVADTFKLKLLKAGNGDYLAKKWYISETQYLVGIIPLYRKFNISNNYLSTWWNPHIFPSGNISILEPNSSLGIVVCVQGQCPFKISFLRDALPVHQQVHLLAVISFSVSIVLLIVFMYKLARRMKYPAIGFVSLYVFLHGLRLAMIKLNFPNAVYQSDLFNPQFFASSPLNASLGDLILNELAVLLLCFYLFRNYHRFKIFQYLYLGNFVSWFLSILAGLCILFAILFPFLTIQTLYNNSTIALDISRSLDFDSIRIVAITVIIISGVCSFLFAHTFIRLMIADGRKGRVVFSFLMAVLLFALINTLTGQQYVSSLVLGSSYFFLVYFLKLYAGLKRLTFATFSYLFIAIFFLSSNGAYAIHYFSRQEKINNQFKFADDFLVNRDIFGEYLLHETAIKIENDAFIQSRLSTPFLNRDAIRQKIRQVFLPSYFNKYDVEIFLFGSTGEPLNNRSPATLSEFVDLYDKDALRTPAEGVYFITSPSRDIAQKYLVKIAILRTDSTIGYIMLELSLKKIIPENVYPELLVDNSFQQFYHAQDISYAVFSSTSMLFSAGKFNYGLSFDGDLLGDPALYRTGITAAGFVHIGQEDENDRVAVVSSPELSRTYTLANFSFLLVLGLVIILLFLLAQGITNYLGGEKLYFSARIQLLLNLAFFLPLMLVSVTTLNLTNRSSQNQLNEEYLSKAESFSGQLSAQLEDYLSGDQETSVSFENQLTDLAKSTKLDANVYNAEGVLLATSQPQIFENNLLSTFINADALRNIRRGENVMIETERVGKLEYSVSYAALKAPLTGELIGILGIPFFQSGHLMEKVQINILANILNIFALIFIALVILSYFVSLWLTFPLKFITQSLQRTSLTKINQPLKWKADDEIGLMVKEYNQMLFKLSESKAELEQTQRERTWREIAQQVAHEIKNPLTPMKLTLQQLQRSLHGATHTPEKTEKAVSSLLSQVETLNDIASSFSTFAKMPEPVIQRLELVSLVRRIVLLHSQSGDLVFTTSVKEAFIRGDEQLLGRTFSNIILNAFQSAMPGRQQRLRIELEKRSSGYLLIFQDNGKGIEAHIAERIFLSHFSTKKSGSGLGLAIAKQAIEQMEGRIWFETAAGQGTTFFIELPESH
ncbi:MAG: HAMP domain-containing histidine kinase [Cyclobacteriaceae bacterium]|nr:HAMP domain-containing histidine kinase [Cyclobacteriaceae bacterium]